MTDLNVAWSHALASVGDDPLSGTKASQWAASCNIRNQEALFQGIAAAQMVSGHSTETVAERLGISAAELAAVASGATDMTLTELRLFAAACEVVVDYRVAPASSDIRMRNRIARSWLRITNEREKHASEDSAWSEESRHSIVWHK